jgi:hypothetical protein
LPLQILQINSVNVAGYPESKVHDVIQKCGVNNIVMAIRDRYTNEQHKVHRQIDEDIVCSF